MFFLLVVLAHTHVTPRLCLYIPCPSHTSCTSVGTRNNCPEKKVVQTEDAHKFADQIGIELYETSAKENINVEEVRGIQRHVMKICVCRECGVLVIPILGNCFNSPPTSISHSLFPIFSLLPLFFPFSFYLVTSCLITFFCSYSCFFFFFFFFWGGGSFLPLLYFTPSLPPSTHF